MSKRAAEATTTTTTVVYYNSRPCEALKKSDNTPCTNGAYYEQQGRYLCGVHIDKKSNKSNNSKKKKGWTLLPKDKDEKRRRLTVLEDHKDSVERSKRENAQQGRRGSLSCSKMQMMKNVPLRDGVLNVFPNNRHQDRPDGFGCASLSPMRLGPVVHRQPGWPDAKNIENYHQFNKLWANETDEKGDPLPLYWEQRRTGYEDAEPHRHKYDAKTMAALRKAVPDQQNRNAPLCAINATLDGKEMRRFSYVESRYFYCKAYEALAKQCKDFRTLQQMLAEGTNLCLCGYDAYEVTQSMDAHYADAAHAFGHELALYALLTIEEPRDYPWNRYREAHPERYDNISYMLAV